MPRKSLTQVLRHQYIFLSAAFTENCKNISGAPPSVQNYEVCEVTCEERCIQGFVGVTLGKETNWWTQA
jgi:hypothetical protein